MGSPHGELYRYYCHWGVPRAKYAKYPASGAQVTFEGPKGVEEPIEVPPPEVLRPSTESKPKYCIGCTAACDYTWGVSFCPAKTEDIARIVANLVSSV